MRRKMIGLIIGWLFLAGGAEAAIGQLQTRRQRLEQEILSGASAQQRYEQIQENFLKEDYLTAERLSEEFLSNQHVSRFTDEVLYLRGICLMKQNRFEQSRQVFQTLRRQSPNNAWACSMALLGIADTYNAQKNFPEALGVYEQVRKTYAFSEASELAKDKLSRISWRPSLRSSMTVAHSDLPFTLQVGSFSQEKNAKVLQQKLLSVKYEAYIEKASAGFVYRVRIGRFSSYQDAVPLKSRLQADGYQAHIVNRLVYV